MRYVVLSLAGALLFSSAALAQSAVATREAGALVMENVPETPPALRESLRRYQNARSAVFRDWLADGSMLITTRFGATNQLHRVAQPMGVRSQITFYDEPIAGAVAQPDAPGRFVFSRDTGGDEYFQLYASDLAGAEATISEPKTRNTGPLYSRDGRKIAWTRVTPGSGDYDVVVMDAADASSRRVVHEGTGAISPLAFSPDGGKLLLSRYDSVQSSKRYLLDLAGGGGLTEINPSKSEIAYLGGKFTPDGRAVIMISDEGADVGKLVRYELATGAKSVIADGGRWEVENFALADDGSVLAYAVNEDGRSKVILAPFGGRGDLAQPQLPVGVLTALKFTPDGKRLAIGLNTATSPADVWVWDLPTARLTRWTESELGGMDRTGMVEPSLVRFRSFDRREIPAWVYRPKTGGKAPVIVDIHGGPEGQSRPGFNPTHQYWARELGAAVVVPNVRGSTGYGKTYVALDNGPKRQDSVKDIGALLDWIATQPDLDASRVVVTGGSYGGFMTLAALAAYNDKLAGAVESVGISDFETFLKNTEGYRRDLRRAEYGDERDPAMQKVFRQISPIHLTGKMTKPLFVSAGFNDPRVPWTEGQQIVRKVRANGGEVWWMMAKDEGHGFAKKPNRDALREAETLFLKKVFGLD